MVLWLSRVIDGAGVNHGPLSSPSHTPKLRGSLSRMKAISRIKAISRMKKALIRHLLQSK
jgi:hypothetical protein